MFDCKTLLRHAKEVRKAAKILASSLDNKYPETGFVRLKFANNQLGNTPEAVYCTLEGDGPFYLVDSRLLRQASGWVKPFEFNGTNSIAILGHLRLMIVAEIVPQYEYMGMFPGKGAVLFFHSYIFVRWADEIYRRIILTLTVWNLAEWLPGEIPHFGWVKNRWKKDK